MWSKLLADLNSPYMAMRVLISMILMTSLDVQLITYYLMYHDKKKFSHKHQNHSLSSECSPSLVCCGTAMPFTHTGNVVFYPRILYAN